MYKGSHVVTCNSIQIMRSEVECIWIFVFFVFKQATRKVWWWLSSNCTLWGGQSLWTFYRHKSRGNTRFTSTAFSLTCKEHSLWPYQLHIGITYAKCLVLFTTIVSCMWMCVCVFLDLCTICYHVTVDALLHHGSNTLEFHSWIQT